MNAPVRATPASPLSAASPPPALPPTESALLAAANARANALASILTAYTCQAPAHNQAPLFSAEANALAEFVRALIHLELLKGQFIYGPPERVHLAPGAAGNFLGNTISGHIHVGENAFFGHYCMLLTGTHDVTKFGAEMQESYPTSGRDIQIGAGAWLGSGVIVLGPCRIGEHAVIGAGSLVTHDIPPYAIAHGHPATVKGFRLPSLALRTGDACVAPSVAPPQP